MELCERYITADIKYNFWCDEGGHQLREVGLSSLRVLREEKKRTANLETYWHSFDTVCVRVLCTHPNDC